MNKIKLNNSVEFPILEYSRYTNIANGRVNSSANFTPSSVTCYDDLIELSQSTITDLRIYHGETEIYHLENQEAKIVSISENMYDEGLSISVTIRFGSDENEE